MKFSDKEKALNLSSLDVVYLDNHILVLDKISGLLTQPNGIDKLSLECIAKKYLKKKFNKKGNVFLQAVHRLDKDVSGLVLFARTSKALIRLNEQMRKKTIIKKYIAQVEGILEKKEDTLIHFLQHINYRTKVYSSKNCFDNQLNEKKSIKKAELKYKVIEENNTDSLLEIILITGRYHQIRAQLAAIGHPIIGDQKYKSKIKYKNINLHSFYLEFLHPITKKNIHFRSFF